MMVNIISIVSVVEVSILSFLITIKIIISIKDSVNSFISNKYDIFSITLSKTRRKSLYGMYSQFIRKISEENRYKNVIEYLDNIITPTMDIKYVPIVQYLILQVGIHNKYSLETENVFLNEITKLKEAIDNNDRESVLSLFGQKISPIRNRKWAKELGFRVGKDRSSRSTRTPSYQSS